MINTLSKIKITKAETIYCLILIAYLVFGIGDDVLTTNYYAYDTPTGNFFNKHLDLNPINIVYFIFMLSVFVIKIYKNEEWKFEMIYVLAIGHLIFMTISFLNLDKVNSELVLSSYKYSLLYNFVFAIIISQMKIGKTFLKILLIGTCVVATSPILEVVMRWADYGFAMNVRIGREQAWISQFAAEVSGYLLVIAVVWLFIVKSRMAKILLGAVAILGFVSLIATKSRGPLGTLVIILFVLLYSKYKKVAKWFLGVMIVIGVLVVATNDELRNKTLHVKEDARYQQWSIALGEDLTLKRVPFGMGYMSYTNDPSMIVEEPGVGYPNYLVPYIHTTALEYLVTQGIFSMLFYFAFFIVFLHKTWQAFKEEHHNRYHKYTLLTGFVLVLNYLMMGCIDMLPYLMTINVTIFLYVGVCISLWKRKAEKI